MAQDHWDPPTEKLTVENSPGGFLLFDVGCIECGEPSKPIGFYTTLDEAKLACDNYTDSSTRWGRADWHGSHDMMVFEL